MSMPLHVLIVEDTPTDAELMVMRLSAEGFQFNWQVVQTEADYLTALEAFPDLILADWSLPQFSGLRALQLRRERNLDIPFIIVSGSIGEEAAIDALRQGASDYVLKDRPARLGPAVRRAQEDHRLQVEKQQAEIALRVSEERHRLLFDNAGLGIGYYTLDGHVAAFNRLAVAHMSGEPNEYTGKSLVELYGEAAGAIYLERIRDAASTPENREYEDFVSLPAGDKWFLSTYSRIVGTTGQVVGVQIISSDITDRKRAEESLRASEQELTRAQHIGRLGNWSWDITGNTLTWSDEIYYLFGVDKQHLALTYENIENRVHPEDRETNSAMVAQLLESDHQIAWEFRIIRPDGAVRWIHQRAQVARDSSGQPSRAFGIMQDISERKQAEEALRESERFARSTLDGLSAHIAILDETGTILAVNHRWRVFAEENAPVTANLNEETNYLAVCDRATGPQSEGAAEFATAIRAVIDGTIDHFELEYPCHSDREQRWFVGRVTRFPGLGPVRVVVAHENITQIKLVELKLAEERGLLRTLIDNLPDRVYAKDVEGRYTLKNATDVRQMGASSTDEAIGKTDYDYYPSELAEQYHTDDLNVIQSGNPLINQEERIITADGTQGWILTSKVPLRDAQGNVIGLVGIGRDITERKRAEEELRRNEAHLRSVVSILQHRAETSQEFLDYALNEAIKLTGSKVGYIYYYDKDREQFILNTWSTDVMCDCMIIEPQTVYDLDKTGIWGEAVRQRKPIVLNDFQADHALKKGYPEGHTELHKYVTVPIFAGDHIVAVIGVANKAADYTDTDVLQLTLLMDAVWKVVDRQRAQEELREHNRRLSALNSLGIALAEMLTLPRIFQTVYEHVSQLMDCPRLGISLYDSETRTLQTVFMVSDGEILDSSHFHRLIIDETAPPDGRARTIIIQQPEIVRGQPPDPSEQTPPADLPGDDRISGSALYVPMIAEGRTIGLLEVESYPDNAYGDADVALLGPVANQVGLAIQNARLFADLETERSSLEQRVVERTAQLNSAKERIETILNSSNDVIILCRTDGSIDQVNPAFDKAFRCEPTRVYNQPLTLLATPEYVTLLEEVFSAVVQNRQSERLEMVARCKGGESFEADVVLSPIVQPDTQLSGVVCSLRDITERKKMEAQLRQMLEHEIELGELKSRYVSIAAHDLRNPLAAIQSTVEVIENYHDRFSDEQLRVKYLSIHRSLRVMVDLLNDTLTLGQTGSGKLKFEPNRLNLHHFVQELVADLHEAIGNAQRIAYSYQGGCDTVCVDAKLLRHVLSNLLSNALKYSADDSQVNLHIKCQPNLVAFRIQDKGIGIPQKDQQRLFEAFHRAGNVGNISGTGLGLAIVKQSVDLHGGVISFESVEGVGTIFTVVLPQSPVNE